MREYEFCFLAFCKKFEGDNRISFVAIVAPAVTYFSLVLHFGHFAEVSVFYFLSSTPFKFKFDYINTPSSKMVFDILTLLGQIKGASATWYYRKEQEGIKEIGEELKELVQFPFEERVWRN